MWQFLNTRPGAVSVSGLLFDTKKGQLVLGAQLLPSEYIGCHPFVNATSLKIRTSGILQTFLPFAGHDYLVVLFGNDLESKDCKERVVFL